MKRDLICIECPKGCALTVVIENGKVKTVEGYTCEKGEQYAITEIECPMRILTSTVLAQGFVPRMVPVRTDRPIPKERIFDAMQHIHQMRITSAVNVGDILCPDFIIKGVNLIVTRDASILEEIK